MWTSIIQEADRVRSGKMEQELISEWYDHEEIGVCSCGRNIEEGCGLKCLRCEDLEQDVLQDVLAEAKDLK